MVNAVALGSGDCVDPGYRWAVVGHPSREYLWILSRTPSLEPAVYDRILALVKAQGYDLERLNRTPQPTSPAAEPAGGP